MATKEHNVKAFNMKKLSWALVSIVLVLLGGTNLWSQSDTRYDAGFNLPFNEKAGDINPQTGNVGIQATDLSLPGRNGLDFSYGRQWNLNQSNVFTMYYNKNDGSNGLALNVLAFHHLGAGWTSNLPAIIRDTSSDKPNLTLFLNGGAYELNQTSLAVDNAKQSNILGYDLTDIRVLSSAAGLSIAYGDYLGTTTYPNLASLVTAYPSLTDKASDSSGYVVIMKDNSRYWLRTNGQIMRQDDRTGKSHIWYFYDATDHLTLVVDSAGRPIRFNYNNDGLLSHIDWDVMHYVNKAGTRSQETETRSVNYEYVNAESFAEIASIKNSGLISDYKTPWALVKVTDPMGNITRYDWQAKTARFTYDSLRSLSANVHLLLSTVTSMAQDDGSYKSQRVLEYEVPAKGMYTKYFYGGFMEYFKLSHQYNHDRHGRLMNDTSLVYHEAGENGDFHSYATALTMGGVTTTYTYSFGGDKRTDQVLASLTTRTTDGFVEEKDFTYNADRTKAQDDIYRLGRLIYSESYQYDSKGNLKRFVDRRGLVTERSYDDIYSIPVHEIKSQTDTSGSVITSYETKTIINGLGQVTDQIQYIANGKGSTDALTVAHYSYDSYGNPVTVTDALGYTQTTDYDLATHSLPVRISQEVTEARSSAGDLASHWMSPLDSSATITVHNWKVYNSDGSVYLEVDNDGWAMEHFYDKDNTEIERIIPDTNDVHIFSPAIELAGAPEFGAFMASRQDNPGIRTIIDYAHDFQKIYTDLTPTTTKVEGKQSDGLGHIEQEILYGAGGAVYSTKTMAYDLLGRNVALTDPDAKNRIGSITVNGVTVDRMDKTWIIKYDDLGRKLLILYPDSVGGPTSIKHMAYDDLANTITTTSPDGRIVVETHDWAGNLTQVSAKGDSTTSSNDYQLYQYGYDQLNRKARFTDPKGLLTTYSYDERNLLLAERYGVVGSADDGGADIYTYDKRGKMLTKTDPKGQVIQFVWDEMGRNTKSDYFESAAKQNANQPQSSVVITYDQRGDAVRIENPNLIEHYVYDAAKRVTRLERKLTDSTVFVAAGALLSDSFSGPAFVFSYNYDFAGQLLSMIQPDGVATTYSYDGILGRLQTIAMVDGATTQAMVSSIDYLPSGQVARLGYGNGASQTWSFDNRKRISEIIISGAGNALIEDNRYTVSADGNILAINENQYGYDGFNRIISAKTLKPGQTDLLPTVAKAFGTFQLDGPLTGVSTATFDPAADLKVDGRINGADVMQASLINTKDTYDIESFAYDSNGNRTRLDQNGDVYTYEYGKRNRLTTVTKKLAGATLGKTILEYSYDANGNTISRKEYGPQPDTQTFTYDVLNRVSQSVINGKTIDYLYDNAGNRFIKKTAEETILYLRHGQIAVALEIVLKKDQTTTKGTVTRYALSGDLIAGESATTIKADGSRETKYRFYHLDHLNSTKVITNEAGVADVRYTYRAFGEQLGTIGTGVARHTYGGKELDFSDEETSLYYFNARYYDAAVGRFISVDPAQDGSNWYVYCSNNPLRFVDPTGLGEFDLLGFLGGVGQLALGVAELVTAAAVTVGTDGIGLPLVIGLCADAGTRFISGGAKIYDSFGKSDVKYGDAVPSNIIGYPGKAIDVIKDYAETGKVDLAKKGGYQALGEFTGDIATMVTFGAVAAPLKVLANAPKAYKAANGIVQEQKVLNQAGGALLKVGTTVSDGIDAAVDLGSKQMNKSKK